MANQIPSAKITLSYPLYVCDWVDANQLVVGGGGGSGRNGVGNKLVSLCLFRFMLMLSWVSATPLTRLIRRNGLIIWG